MRCLHTMDEYLGKCSPHVLIRAGDGGPRTYRSRHDKYRAGVRGVRESAFPE